MLKTKYNATIGMATNKNGKCMLILYLMSIIIYLQMKSFHTPTSRIRSFKDLWQDKMLKNPDLSKETITRPIVTNALTHGLSLIADLFVESGDTVLVPTHSGVTTN